MPPPDAHGQPERTDAVDQALPSEAVDKALDASAAPRAGSPFAIDPPVVRRRLRQASPAAQFESGTWRITAAGAVLAAGMLVLFAVAGAWSFPAGTAMTASLGGVMSLIGLSSPYPRSALVLLVAHVGLFMTAFVQMA